MDPERPYSLLSFAETLFLARKRNQLNFVRPESVVRSDDSPVVILYQRPPKLSSESQAFASSLLISLTQ